MGAMNLFVRSCANSWNNLLVASAFVVVAVAISAAVVATVAATVADLIKSAYCSHSGPRGTELTIAKTTSTFFFWPDRG